MKYVQMPRRLTQCANLTLLALLFVGLFLGTASPSYAIVAIPNAPTLDSVASECGQLTLTWTPGAGLYSGFYVNRSTVSGGPYTFVGSTSSTTFTDTGLHNGTRYYYVVQAWLGYSYAVSNNSNELNNVPECRIAPPWWQVAHLLAIPSKEAVFLEWTPVPIGVDGRRHRDQVTYNVYELEQGTTTGATGTSTGPSWVLIAGGLTGVHYVATGLTDGVAYTFAVTADNEEFGESPMSPPVTVVPGGKGTTAK